MDDTGPGPEMGPTDPGDELLDVVDERDRVIGQATRREVRRRRLLHRFSSVLCWDGVGRVYVHRRTDDKDVYPGMYDMTAGGVLAAGETYLEAARRELAEELGVVGPEPRFLFRHRYRGEENPSWSALFEVTWDGPVHPQASEIAWGAFLPLDELQARIDQWPFCPDALEIYRRWRALPRSVRGVGALAGQDGRRPEPPDAAHTGRPSRPRPGRGGPGPGPR